MMKRLSSHGLLVFFLAAAMNFGSIALGQENPSDEIIARPQIKYKSGQLRDPFAPLMVKEKKKEAVQKQAAVESNQPKIDLGALEVQGIIWGAKVPRAIINNKVLAAGDLIGGAEILSIDKKGVTLSFAGEIVNLPAPRRNSAATQKNNTGGEIK